MRIDGWEGRLAAIVDAARQEPYRLGRHDCFRLVCRVIESLTGVDRWPEFAGYTSRRECMAMIARHGSNFEDAFDWFFEVPRKDVKFARRGDAVAVQTADGEKHLAVCVGASIALLGPDGLVFGALDLGHCAWSIG